MVNLFYNTFLLHWGSCAKIARSQHRISEFYEYCLCFCTMREEYNNHFTTKRGEKKLICMLKIYINVLNLAGFNSYFHIRSTLQYAFETRNFVTICNKSNELLREHRINLTFKYDWIKLRFIFLYDVCYFNTIKKRISLCCILMRNIIVGKS